MLNLRKATLIAGIALAIDALAMAVADLAEISHLHSLQGGIVALLNLLYRTLPPVLLLLLYRSGPVLAVSSAMKRLAMLAAFITGAALVRSLPRLWRTPASALLWHLGAMVSSLAVILFLVALFRNKNTDGGVAAGRSGAVRALAALTVVMWLGSILWGIGMQVYIAWDLQRQVIAGNSPSRGAVIWQYLFNPVIAWTLAAYVIYRSAKTGAPDMPAANAAAGVDGSNLYV